MTPDGLVTGHEDCAEVLSNSVKSFLTDAAPLDVNMQEVLLEEVEAVFTDDDNRKMEAPPSKDEVKKIVSKADHLAAPGTDGIPSLLYYRCFDTLGQILTDVIKEIHDGDYPTASQATSLMVFADKPKKVGSKLVKDKRTLSLLNTDFKVATGLEAARHKVLLDHTASEYQFAVGDSKRIQHAINLARDAIFAASRDRKGCGIADLDFQAAFNYLCMSWVEKVLLKKGLSAKVVNRINRLYTKGVTIPVVNSVLCKPIENSRRTLRQGDCPSSIWFCYGIDPLLIWLGNRLQGITIHSAKVLGPLNHDQKTPLKNFEYKYKVVGFCDDIKPAIITMDEFRIADLGASMFEKSSGCKLHRDPASNKCKFLPLG